MAGYRYMIGLGALVVMAACSCARAAIAVVNSGVGWIERVVGWAYSSIAKPFTMQPVWGGLATAGAPSLDYAAPAPHFLRHEAGTSRRAAARHT